MKPSHRLSGDLPPEFSRPLIDRSRPIRFRLNGRVIEAFAGDTVLSALLASGIAAAGRVGGSPLALDEHSAPAVAPAGNEQRPDLAMPMALCPAVEGAHFVTLGPRPSPAAPLLTRIFARAADSLGLAYASAAAEPGGWIDAAPSRTIETDLIVVGGGVAGLSAALAAAERDLRVVLLERDPVLGGLSVFFGKADGEPNPEEMTGELTAKVAATEAITVLANTLAHDLSGTTLRAVRVAAERGQPRPEHIAVTGRAVVLATGTAGRLPVFPGNRLPGVVDAAFAWRMAARFNVWPGASAHVHTATNVGYRMALLGAASGKSITRASDPRPGPQTRFIEFCKAYGYRLSWGVAIGGVERRGGGLSVLPLDSETRAASDTPLSCDRLIVSAGWQPDLDLWLKAAGPVVWNAASQRLVPDGRLDGVALAGSAAGYLGLAGCAGDGRAAVTVALGGTRVPVDDPRIDPMFETPDGPLTVSPPSDRRQPPAFVGPAEGGILVAPPPAGWTSLFLRPPAKAAQPRAAQTQLDVVGAIAAGVLDPASAPRFCAEHCIVPHRLHAAEPPLSPSPAPSGLPAWLAGRFGPDQRQWRLTLAQDRRLDAGCLVFANTDGRAPDEAIGVVLWEMEEGIAALMGSEGLAAGDTVYVRDGLVAVPVTLREKL